MFYLGIFFCCDSFVSLFFSFLWDIAFQTYILDTEPTLYDIILLFATDVWYLVTSCYLLWYYVLVSILYYLFISYLHGFYRDTNFLSGIFSHSDSISSYHLHLSRSPKKLPQLTISHSNSLPSFIYQDSPSKKVNKVGLEIVIASKDDYV